MNSFDQMYRQLNQTQRQAVDAIDGPVMVLAGPGTGKTQVLAVRIAQILQKTDTPAHAILALTFTESAASNMRKRLVQLIGKAGYNVQINTFHAFCSQVIQDHPEYFPIDRNSQPLTDLQRYQMFESLIVELTLKVLKPLNRQLYYITDIMKALSDLKREGISPEKFAEIVTRGEQDVVHREKLSKSQLTRLEKNQAKHQDLLLLYTEYQKRLRQELRYDFDDMIMLVKEAFSQDSDLLLDYQENIHYFLVDEYQDTNAAQNQVVDLLASHWKEQANIFVVGDPNQAIYRFQGASTENAMSFIERYSQATLIQLTQGYRCSNIVYDRAFALIGNNSLQEAFSQKKADIKLFQQPLSNLNSKKGELPIKIYQAPSQTLEIVYVVEQIQQLLKKGTPAEEIAVLYRHNRDVIEIQEVLEKWGIAYEIDGGNNILKTELVQKILFFLSTIYQTSTQGTDDRVFEVLQYPWFELDSLLILKIARAASKARMTILEMIDGGFKTFTKYDQGPAVTLLEFETVVQTIDQFRKWQVADVQMPFPVWFEHIINESGLLSWILKQQNKIELLHYLQSLFQQVKTLGQKPGFGLVDFLEAVATMDQHNISIQAEDLNVTRGAVHLSSVHKAKGQEWQHVFLIHCFDGKWGNARSRELIPLPEGILTQTDTSKKERNEDDRRLFYVGLTRAKKQVTVTSAETIITETNSKQATPSMFIEELQEGAKPGYLEKVIAPEITQQADQFLVKLLEPAAVPDYSEREKTYFQSLVQALSLSVTALNTYLRSPEEFLENVLLKVPQLKPEPMSFGTAIHAALEKMYQPLLSDQSLLPLKEVLAVFEKSLVKELMGSDNFARRLAHGKEILTDYYQQTKTDQKPPLFVERFFGTGLSRTYLGDIPLKGRVDRVDWLNVEAKKVKVIDYKTGKPKSVNEIEGAVKSMPLSERERALPESIRGPYKRQLLFYKLLADLDPTFVYEVIVGEFVFIEPSTSGKLVSRSFELKHQDVEDLKQLIKEVMSEIRQLKFLDTAS